MKEETYCILFRNKLIPSLPRLLMIIPWPHGNFMLFKNKYDAIKYLLSLANSY